jgi:HPt (histidine-containing phosphotransfer) domain-containing protein
MENIDPIFSIYADDPVLSPLIWDFAEELPAIVEQLKNNLRRRDTAKAIAESHRLAGSLATYGFQEFASLFSQMEKELKGNTFPEQWDDRERKMNDYCSRISMGIKGN